MNAQTISTIHDFTLQARKLMLKEVDDQLEGVYGLLPSGEFEPADKYPALNTLDEARETRRRMEQFFADEKAAGISAKEARDKLAKEIAFTRLNRMVALKMMETRGLIRQSVSRGTRSNGFLRWLTRPGNEADYEKYEAGDLPQNALGEGPRQEAYRHYLLWQCVQLSQEIKVLFDPDNLPSRIFPRPRALNRLIDMMNAPELEEAWALGNEETIGWVYQSFNSEELEKAFREVRLSGKKFEAKDIPAVTQLFTPRWIVRYLIENTLGRLWIDMHPDSNLKHELKYLVPIKSQAKAELKPANGVKLLDPACGTMHFGLVAFDLFAEMYKEEIEKAGQPGWPEKPSVEGKEDIPAAILSNNLYGIDIDLRAVQLSALTLFLKAKSLNPKASLTESKLVAANIQLGDENRMKRFLDDIGLRKPIYKRILTTLSERLCDSEQLGSLLRLEEEIRTIVEKERDQFNKEGRQLDLFGQPNQTYEKEAVQLEFWDALEAQIEQTLHHFAKFLADKGEGQSFFVGETTKGLRLLEVLSNRYDVVVTNPPYMSNRKMNSRLKTLVARDYPEGKGDLYAAFIKRCMEMAERYGRIGMLTMHSFMFISSYRKLREWILKCGAIETLAHAGPALFAVGNPGTLQTAAYVIRKEPDESKREDAIGTYFRLVREPDAEGKRRGFESAVECLRTGEDDTAVYRYRQVDFDAIAGVPWVYWISEGLRKPFERLSNFEQIAKLCHGMSTGNNFRFLRYWWEVGKDAICVTCVDRESLKETDSKWFPYMKGGSFKRWYGNQSFIINYHYYGMELISAKQDGTVPGHRHDNPQYYFMKGVTWSDLTSGRFAARLSPGGFIFDVKGSSAFPDDIPLVLALLNSSFAHYILSLLNPTVSFQVGDLSRLPVPATSSELLRELVNLAVDLTRLGSAEDETTYDFIAPSDWHTGIEDVAERATRLAEIEHQIDEEVYRLYGISNEDRTAIETELTANDVEKNETDETETSPPLLAREELARQWLSYAMGIVMGRFEPGMENGLGRGNFSADIAKSLQALADPDSILVMDEGHTDDLPVKVLEALAIMLGASATEDVVKTATSKDGPAEDLLRAYLERTFFKAHIKQYRKRPVYWLLQSPRKKYGVWLFHERMNQDTLFRIQTEYVASKLNLLESQIAALRSARDTAESREKRRIEKRIGELTDILDDIREFQNRLKFISEERGYTPHIDDGVLLNMAPLWELIPSWQAEPKKAWNALERGDYDWAYQAMDHWPERVKAKCKTHKSYAIAHGLEFEE